MKTLSDPREQLDADADAFSREHGIRTDAELIGVDWGTSNLRIMRISADGDVVEARLDPRGASRLDAGEFSGVLREVAADWIEEGTPVLVCGMAGARGKWRETGYVDCPAGPEDLAPVSVAGGEGQIRVVPGVSLTLSDGLADVMRGEETQAAGMPDAAKTGIVVTPGTHSKWMVLERGKVVRFRSFMTGELFAAIRAGTVLGQDMGEPGVDMGAFEDGVRRALADSALTAILFSVRTERLANRLPATSSADYLSGLLIGAEIAAQQDKRSEAITLVGTPDLNERYARALGLAGFANVTMLNAEETTARGLWRIFEAHR